LPGQNLQIETREGKAAYSKEEKEEDPSTVKTKAKLLADKIRQSKSCIIFTGAGISTSAKIPDFRGPEGVWTLKAQGLEAKSIDLESAVPTTCHMAILTLLKHFQTNNKMMYIVSQNIDGLHRRSGIPASDLSELHGNSFKEVCWKCDSDYLRTFDAAATSGVGGLGCKECLARVPKFCHCTKRKCNCGATLKDSIIHFGEDLPKSDWKRAEENAKKADLCIVFGSSLTVSPADKIPKFVLQNNGQLCIVNAQSTPLDSDAHLRIFGKTDDVCQLVMEELNIPVDTFKLSSFFTDPSKCT